MGKEGIELHELQENQIEGSRLVLDGEELYCSSQAAN